MHKKQYSQRGFSLFECCLAQALFLLMATLLLVSLRTVETMLHDLYIEYTFYWYAQELTNFMQQFIAVLQHYQLVDSSSMQAALHNCQSQCQTINYVIDVYQYLSQQQAAILNDVTWKLEKQPSSEHSNHFQLSIMSSALPHLHVQQHIVTYAQ